MPRELLARAGRLARLLRLPEPYPADVVRTAYAPGATITHRVNVVGFARQKRDAFLAHRSQFGAVSPALAAALRWLPPRLFAVPLGREWFVDPAHRGGPVRRDIFD